MDRTHVHRWGRTRYVDGCHYVLIVRTCVEEDCGATDEAESPRDFNLNPLQIAFARLDCSHCRQAVRGLEPDAWKAPKGRINAIEPPERA
jgi:hypothetical protein